MNKTNTPSGYLKNTHTLKGHSGAIYDVIYANNHLYTASADKFIAQWDIVSGKQTDFAIHLERSSYSLDYSPSSQLLAIGTNNGGIHVIDTENREEKRLLTQHKSAIFSLTYNEQANQFYSGDEEGFFCAWKGDNFDLLITLPYDCGKIRKIAVSEDGKKIALCCQDGYLRILETQFFNLIHEIKINREGVNCAVFAGEMIYVGGKDALISKWNWKEKKLLQNIPAHHFPVYDMELLKDGKYLISASFDKRIKLWKVGDDLAFLERIEYKNEGHRHTVNKIAKISENSFATVSDDRTIKVWNLNV